MDNRVPAVYVQVDNARVTCACTGDDQGLFPLAFLIAGRHMQLAAVRIPLQWWVPRSNPDSVLTSMRQEPFAC